MDNCQVGVFAALGKGHLSTLIDERLYLPKEWVLSPARCRKAGIQEVDRVHKSKSALALEMVRHHRALGVWFAWVGADGGYGKEPAFLRGLEALGEIFVVDIHKDQRLYLEAPRLGDTRGIPCTRTPVEPPASSDRRYPG